MGLLPGALSCCDINIEQLLYRRSVCIVFKKMLSVLGTRCIGVLVLAAAVSSVPAPRTRLSPMAELQWQELTEYVDKLRSSLQYMVDYSAESTPRLLSPTRIAPGEAHIVFKLHRSLKDLLQHSSPTEVSRLMTDGYQCSLTSREQQEILLKKISMGLCSEIEWYKLAALAAPQVRIIADVGSNKGLLSALFMSLWGGGDAKGITPMRVYDIAAQHGLVAPSHGRGGKGSGFCKYGSNQGTPLHCAKQNRDNVALTCRHRADKGDLELFSFDGASEIAALTHDVQSTLAGRRNSSGPSNVAQGVWWRHYHAAVGSSNYVANFTLPTAKAGNDGSEDAQSKGFEGGTLWLKPNPQEGGRQRFELVNVTTIDSFVAKTIGQPLHFLKVDAEGKDRDVLEGAAEQIRSHLSLFSFECAPCALKEQELRRLDDLGYACYSLTRAGLFKWTGNCTSDSFWQVRKKSMGNVLCASRNRAPLLALSLDMLSFPSLLRTANVTTFDQSDHNPAGSKREKGLGKGLLLTRQQVVQVFIRWSPFCTPWPRCLLKNVESRSEDNSGGPELEH